jgi:hypothetical protein
MKINRMLSHDDFDEDDGYMCIALGKTFDPDEDYLEPYYEEDEEERDAARDSIDDERRRDYFSQSTSTNNPLPIIITPSSPSPSLPLSWSGCSQTNYSSKSCHRKKGSYIEIDQTLLHCFSLEIFQNIQNLNENQGKGIFGHARMSGGDLGRAVTIISDTFPSIETVQHLLLILIQHNAIEYEILICCLIYYRRLCGLDKITSPFSISTFSSSGSASGSLFSTIATVPITPHNWKGILIGSLRLATKLWDDFSLMNRDFLEPLRKGHIQGEGLGSGLDCPLSINEIELSLVRQLNYNLLITESEYQKCHEMITRSHLSLLSCSSLPSTLNHEQTSTPLQPSPDTLHTASAGVTTPPLVSSLSATRFALGGGGQSTGGESHVSGSPPSPAPSPAPSRQTSRSWSWKLKINRVAVSTDEEEATPPS